MSIGNDIAEVLEEVGSSIVILSSGAAEFVDIEINFQVTKPLIMSYFKKCTLAYDSTAVCGDIINFDTTGDYYLITTLNSEEFENAIITKQGLLYMCNVSGELLRSSGEAWNTQTYHKEPAWETIKSDCYALLVNPEFRNKLIEEEAAMVSMEEDELYLPHSAGVRVNDRYEAVSGEFYKVEVVNSYRYFNVDVCRISEDTR